MIDSSGLQYNYSFCTFLGDVCSYFCVTTYWINFILIEIQQNNKTYYICGIKNR